MKFVSLDFTVFSAKLFQRSQGAPQPYQCVGNNGISSTIHSKKDLAVAVVRVWREQLLGVACGRMSQRYQSITRLVLHRYLVGKSRPFEKEILSSSNSIYVLVAGDCGLILDIIDEQDDYLLEKVKSEVNFEGFQGAATEALPGLQNLQADLSIMSFQYAGYQEII